MNCSGIHGRVPGRAGADNTSRLAAALEAVERLVSPDPTTATYILLVTAGDVETAILPPIRWVSLGTSQRTSNLEL